MGLNTPISFCEWLKLRRKALDMTQEELARRAGCSVAALRKIEAGDRRPSKQLAALLAQALEISEEEQAIFIRVARGELNMERLGQSSLERARGVPDIASLRQIRHGPALEEIPPATFIHGIPLQTTPLIGRENELAAMERLFNNQQCRLLTLTGIGGIGKTRLAIEFGLRRQREFLGGVFYIPLTSVDSAEKIVPAIADVLGFGFSGPAEPKEQLLNTLASLIKREALFIFDNLEHLLAETAAQDDRFSLIELTAEMLQRLPNVKILGTSRERMNLHGEWTYELHGLSVPPTGYGGDAEAYDSILLFMRSAQRIRSDFQASDEEQQSLVEITRLVEGVPLAIELAAAWVGVLSCQEIVREIKANMDFLTTSMRDIPERHRSIRATFDHSWKLLSDEERRVLSRLSVFHGGFDRKAAEQIAGATLPLLASLSDKSLVRRSESGRFDLHEVIRQYALTHLNVDPHNFGTYERHCDYYLKFVREREESLKSASQQEAIRQLIDEIDNIRAAWVWAVQHKKFAKLEQAGRGFGWYYEITGLYREGIGQLESLIQALEAEPQGEQWRRVLGQTFIHQALLHFRVGEFNQARRLYEESIITLRPIGDAILLSDALIYLGIILHLIGEYEQARSSVEEGLYFAQERNARWYEAYAIYNLGYIASLMGHYAEGHEQMLAGLDIWRTIGDPHYIALGLNFLVPTLIQLGRCEEAITFMQESIALCEQSKNRWGLGTAYRFLGLACIADGQYAEAQAHLMRSLEIYGGFTVGYDIARSLAYLGDASLMRGDLTAARKYYLEALHISKEEKVIPIALDVLAGLAELQEKAGNAKQALALCCYVQQHASSEENTKSRTEKLCKRLEEKLSPEQIEAARSMVQNTAFEAAVKEAMETI